MMTRLSDFDYYLPEELIAQEPVSPRDSSKLMVFTRKNGKIGHKKFSDILNYLNEDDVLVVNDTKVIPARLFGSKKETGGKVEILLLRQATGPGHQARWEALSRPAKRIKEGMDIIFADGKLQGRIVEKLNGAKVIIKFNSNGDFLRILNKVGRAPLPPYIRRQATGNRYQASDKEWYQTVYAAKDGAVAAPTAGLHFTRELLEKIKEKGVKIFSITLHVGWGTFKPIREEDIKKHKMEAEYCRIDQRTGEAIRKAKKDKKKIIAVGTTTCRALESFKGSSEDGWTDLFIYPGYKFKVIDALITNFHLPRSSLMMLVSAFAAREKILQAYAQAVKYRYRFYSYGDAMLIV